MDVSVIIVNYNTKQLTANCIDSVFEKTEGIDFEIILVDNASTDGSKEFFRNDKRITFVESPENIGFGRANNLGAKYAKGKYLFLLNSDTILLNNAVKVLADFLEGNSNVGICGGNLFDENKEPTQSYNSYLPSIEWELNVFSVETLGKMLHGKNLQFNHTKRSIEVGYITGADLMIRIDLFRQLGGFDSDFFMYYEETELTYRVKRRGYKVCNIPQANIIHLEGKSFSCNVHKMKLILDSREKYYKKTHSRFYSSICHCIFLLTILSRYLIFKMTGNVAKATYWKYMLKYFKI